MELCLLPAVCLVPLTALTLFIFLQLIVAVDVDPLPVVMNQMFSLTFANNLYSPHAGQTITHLLPFFPPLIFFI